MLLSTIYTLFRQIYRDKVAFLSFLGLLIFTIIGSIFAFVTFDLINLVNKSNYIQITSMLFLLIIGVKLGGMEQSSKCYELFSSITNSNVFHKAAKIVIGFLLAIFLFFLNVLILFVLWTISKNPITVFNHTLSYLILRMLIPFATCIVISLTIGEHFPLRISYGVVILIWCFISPISSITISYIFTALNISSEKLVCIFKILNMGGRISFADASPYGLNQGLPLWISNLVLFFCSICYMMIFPKTKSNVTRFIYSISFLGLVLGGISLISSDKIVFYFNSYDTYSIYKTGGDTNYYRSLYEIIPGNSFGNQLKEDALPQYSKSVNFKITSYDVNLQPGYFDANFECDIKLSALDKTNMQAFTLYHGFKINSILVDGNPVGFEQSGDYFNVSFPRSILANDKVVLHINYSGISSANYPANREIICLPSTFPWIPRLGMVLPPDYFIFGMSERSILSFPIESENSINYSITVHSMNPTVYVNLPQTSTNKWVGGSNSGVTIISADLLTCDKMENGINVYYPAPLKQYLAKLVENANRLTDTRVQLQELIDLHAYENIDKDTIVVLPCYPGNPNAQNVLSIVDNRRYIYFNSTGEAYSYLYMFNEEYANEKSVITGINSLVYTPSFIESYNKEPLSMIMCSIWQRWCISRLIWHNEIKIDLEDDYDTYYAGTGKLYSTSKEQLRDLGVYLSTILNSNKQDGAKELFSWWFRNCQLGESPNINEYLEIASRITKSIK